jgi:hypothetical protein
MIGSEMMGAIARLMQVVGMPVVIALGGWIGVSISEMRESIVRLETQMMQAMKDPYYGADARRDFTAIGVRLDNADRRIEQINTRLQNIENRGQK